MTAARYTRARELARLTIAQASAMLSHRDASLLAMIENGEHYPSQPLHEAIVRLYDVSSAWLRGAKPVIPPAAEQLIARNPRLYHDDRAALLELLGAIYTPGG